MNSINRYAKSLLAKPFVILTGNSGTGKSKIATLFAKWLVPEANTAFVPVGADWTDNRNVLGYVNLLKPPAGKPDGCIYEATPILELLFKAYESWKNNDRIPYFLILDEMNLSHVERYFSDFLAHIESPDQPIRLHSHGVGKVFFNFDQSIAVPETIPLPPNLFVIGTVNVDETTYMFSPKVLDRSNVIEFKTSKNALEIAQAKPPGDDCILAVQGLPSAASFLETALRARNLGTSPMAEPGSGSANPALQAVDGSAWTDYRDSIIEVFEILQRRNQEFGFRVQKEMLAYGKVDYHLHVSDGGAGHPSYMPPPPPPAVAATTAVQPNATPEDAPADGANAPAPIPPVAQPPVPATAIQTPAPQPWDWERCFDEQLMQKVLPKMHGDQAKLELLLAALLIYCRKSDPPQTREEQFQDALKATETASADAKIKQTFKELEEIEQSAKQPAGAREARFCLSYAKVFRMLATLRRDQFVSYIQ